MYILVASTLIFFILAAQLYRLWTKSMAASIILTFTAESLLVRNIHPDRRARFVVGKAEKNRKSINVLARPLAVWYIRNRGLEIATGFLRFIVTDLREDENIELIQ